MGRKLCPCSHGALSEPDAAHHRDVGASTAPGAYDAQLQEAWGGPAPKHYPHCLAEWPRLYALPPDSSPTALVTGGTSGVGFYVAQLLAALGYEVLLPIRHGFPGEAASAAARVAAAVPGARVKVLDESLELASLESVRRYAAAVREAVPSLDLLCLNAGRGGAKGDQREVTADGLEAIMQVNALSHFLLCAELMPLLRAAPSARVVVQTSSARCAPGAHLERRLADLNAERREARFNAFGQYRLSKAAGCLFVRALNEKLTLAGVNHVVACACDPGLAATGVNAQHNLAKSLFFLPDGCFTTRRLHDWVGQHAADGALPMVLACVDPQMQPNDWYTPAWGLKGKPVKGDPARHMQAAVDPLNPRSKWPSSAPGTFWEQAASLTRAVWEL